MFEHIKRILKITCNVVFIFILYLPYLSVPRHYFKFIVGHIACICGEKHRIPFIKYSPIQQTLPLIKFEQCVNSKPFSYLHFFSRIIRNKVYQLYFILECEKIWSYHNTILSVVIWNPRKGKLCSKKSVIENMYLQFKHHHLYSPQGIQCSIKSKNKHWHLIEFWFHFFSSCQWLIHGFSRFSDVQAPTKAEEKKDSRSQDPKASQKWIYTTCY